MTQSGNPDCSNHDVERALASFGAPAMAYRTFGVMAAGSMAVETQAALPGSTRSAVTEPPTLAADGEVDPLLLDLVHRALSGQRPALKQILSEIPNYLPAPMAPSPQAGWLAKILAPETLTADSKPAEASWLSDTIYSPADGGRQMANLES